MTKARDLASIPAGSGDFSVGGGIYLGGATAANYLDDYEEGTWTPTDASGAGLAISVYDTASYTVIGNLCYFTAFIVFPSTSNTSVARISLPFASGGVYSSFSKSYISGSNSQLNWLPLTGGSTLANFGLRAPDGGDYQAQNVNLSGKSFIVSGCYKIA